MARFIIVVLTAGSAMAASGFVRPLAAYQVQEVCAGFIDGAQTPQLVPDAYAWNALWSLVDSALRGSVAARRQLAGELALTGRTLEIVLGAKARALARRADIQPPQRSVGTTPSHGVEPADIALDARDELVRALPREKYDDVQGWVARHRAEAIYRFGDIGTLLPPDASGQRRCRVSVAGRTHPELIPESYYWEIYFRVLAASAQGRELNASTGQVSEEYMRALQRYTLPLAAAEIQLVLRIAADAAGRIDQLPRSSSAIVGTDRPTWISRETFRIVTEARDELVRSLPPSAWSAVRHDADRVRMGATFDFPAR